MPRKLRRCGDDAAAVAAAAASDVPAGGKRSAEKLERRRAQKAAKRAKLHAHLEKHAGYQAFVTPTVASTHPFDADERDHAETPFNGEFSHAPPSPHAHWQHGMDGAPMVMGLREGRAQRTAISSRFYSSWRCV
jgi:hypothetical protein